MKTDAAPKKPASTDKNIARKKTTPQKSEELKTDYPLSEKDEVKQAEKNLKESQKKNG